MLMLGCKGLRKNSGTNLKEVVQSSLYREGLAELLH